MSQSYVGQITLFAGNFAPRGWAFCNGQLLNINQYTALFSILGITYGGNGTTNFALPDLRSRVPVHAGQGAGLSNYVLGQQTGTETVTLQTNQIPAHVHGLTAIAAVADSSDPTNNRVAIVNDGNGTNWQAFATASSPQVNMNQASIGPAGGSGSHPNIQPVLALNYIICLQGLFPSRN